MQTDTRSDVGGVIVAAVLIGIACLVLWDTTTYVDLDSKVFPRTVAIVLILASLGYIVLWLLGRTAPEPRTEGSWPRRILLVLVMLASVLAMPLVGFLAASLAMFALLLVVAMYDPWTPYRVIVYPIVGVAVVLGFYYIFSELLLVPLPTASLF